MWGIDSPPRFEGWRPVEAAPRRRKAAGPGRCGGGAAGSRWWLGLGENGEGSEGTLLLSSPWAGMERGGRPTAAGGEQQMRLWRRRCGLGRKAHGGGGSCGGRELREGAIYRPGEAVERAGQVAGWRAPRTAINGARGVVDEHVEGPRALCLSASGLERRGGSAVAL